MVIKLTPEIKEFIRNHLQDDVTKLILQAKKYPEIPINFVALQIQARQKLKYKLPEWTDNENITFASVLSTEQSSSEITAKFKADLVTGDLLIDLTGGMGVDISYMSKGFEKAIYLEQNEGLKTVTKQNFEVLGLNKIQCFCLNSVDFLRSFGEEYNFLEKVRFDLTPNPSPAERGTNLGQTASLLAGEGLGVTNASGEVNHMNFIPKNLIYLDPARRNEQGGKVVLLQDYEPNILEIKDLLFQKTDRILLKTSPMLDIDLAVNSLQNVSKVWVVAVDNEVKELLFLIEKNHSLEPELLAVNISSKQKSPSIFSGVRNFADFRTSPPTPLLLRGGHSSAITPLSAGEGSGVRLIKLKSAFIRTPIFSFKKSDETSCQIEYSLPKKYLYEPNAALMKVGAFKSIAFDYSLKKIHPNSHLYTSDELVNDFAGRTFEIKSVESLDKKRLLTFLPEKKANISIRNFPLTVRQIREKIGVQDGGNVYLIATTNCENQKIVLVCGKVAKKEE